MYHKKLLSLAALCAGSAAINASAQTLNCSGLNDWNASTAYTGGMQVQDAGSAYEANWWTRGDIPAQHSGQYQQWTSLGVCDDSASSSSSSSVSSSSSSSSSSLSSSSSSVPTGSCGSPGYVAGTSYSGGDLVENLGNEYRCDVAGWCSSNAAWAYEPGAGAHWQDAWTLVQSCDGGSSSSSSSTSSSSSNSSSSSSVPGGGYTGDFPRHALVGYWHNFQNPAGCPIPLSQISDAWDVIDIAFADNDPASNGTVHFNLFDGSGSSCAGLDPAQFKQDMAAMQAQGKIFVLSLGGAEGTITLNTDADEANFVSSLTDLINEWGFDGIDIDLESGSQLLHGTQIQARLPGAIRAIDTNVGGMALTMAPEHPYVQGGHTAYGGIWGAYLPIIDQTRDLLDLLHVQLYNNGGLQTPYAPQSYPAGSVDMMVASARMLIEGFQTAGNVYFEGLDPQQVSLGLPSGPASAGSGQATNQAIMDALDCITRGTQCGSIDAGGIYPDFSGVMTWSINWDIYDGFIFSGPIGDKVDNLP
ncbi:glycosyl hydrolase family 18 protein [uncultured Gilvimarinus sp.]|uniref:chitinase n=1 Tax=uncultured Gilvimarinus sp. TaxID=1689143 RepID=UPI0030EB5CF3